MLALKPSFSLLKWSHLWTILVSFFSCNYPLKGDPFSLSIRTGDIHVHVHVVLDGESVFDLTSPNITSLQNIRVHSITVRQRGWDNHPETLWLLITLGTLNVDGHKCSNFFLCSPLHIMTSLNNLVLITIICNSWTGYNSVLFCSLIGSQVNHTQ